MHSRRLIVASAAVVFATSPVLAEAPARVRGTITAVDDASLTVREQDGTSFVLKTGSTTRYAEVVPSNLDSVTIGEYIGTAIKGPLSGSVAVEIVLVPESMRAGRIGYYQWDPLPDTSGIGSSGPSQLTETAMTNGTVVSNTSGTSDRIVTVALTNGETVRIAVSSTAPITRFVPADRSAIAPGSKAVVWTTRGLDATLVAVGKGIDPPM